MSRAGGSSDRAVPSGLDSDRRKNEADRCNGPVSRLYSLSGIAQDVSALDKIVSIQKLVTRVENVRASSRGR